MPLHPNSRDNGKTTRHIPRSVPNPPLHATPSHPDRNDDAVPHILLGVQGRDYALQMPTDDHIELATTQRALIYARHLFRHDIPAAEPRDLTHTLAQLRIKYSRAESERLA